MSSSRMAVERCQFFLDAFIRWRVAMLMLVIGLVAASSVIAQRPAATPEETAKTFLTHVETSSLAEIYDSELGPSFKQSISKTAFVQGFGVMKIQMGGAVQARQFIGGQEFSTTQTGQTGTFYYVRFKSKFPDATVFQDVYLEKVAGAWKISGFYTIPAPPN